MLHLWAKLKARALGRTFKSPLFCGLSGGLEDNCGLTLWPGPNTSLSHVQL